MTTRAELIADLDIWLARDDLSSGGSEDTLLRIAQANIDRVIRPRTQKVNGTLVCSSRSTALPAGFQALRSLTLQSDLDRTVEYLTPERIREAPIWNNQGGGLTDNTATAYTIEGDVITLAPAPTAGAPVTLDIVYFARFDTLTNPSDTNWLLTNHYDAYLWAILNAAAIFLEDTELQIKYTGLFDAVVNDIRTNERRARFPAGGGLISTGHPRAVV